MKKFFTPFLLLAATAFTAPQADAASLPYQSNMGENYSICSDWTVINKGRGKSWTATGSTGYVDWSNVDSKTGAQHLWDSSNDAKCWLISPEFDLKAGSSYEVSVWVQTRGGDPENFKVCYGSAPTDEAMTNLLCDYPDFKSSGTFTKLSWTISPEADMATHIGFYCYSTPSCYDLTLTQFSIVDKNASPVDPVDPIDPDDPQPEPIEDAVALPFDYIFDSAANFAADWTCGYGPDAAVSSNWSLNEYSKWVNFDAAYGKQEDNYLISAPMAFTEAGPYVVIYKGLLAGKLEFLLGTSKQSLSGYTVIGVKEYEYDGNLDMTVEVPFTIDEPADYRLAIRACADQGTFMGYRMKELHVRTNLPLPSHITDLKAEADANDEVKVALSWTNPALDHQGNPLASLSKIELYRNGELVKDDFAELTPGASISWTDEPAQAGVYTYSVVAYNENGTADGEPLAVKTSYVGHPVAELPYTGSDKRPEDVDLFTMVDANNDGVTWNYRVEAGWWSNYYYLEIKGDVGTEFDDYLISPYVTVTPGYYKIIWDLNCKYNNVELGYVTNRHDPAATFVKLTELTDCQDYASTVKYVTYFAENADIALCVHAVGSSSNSGYLDISMSSFSIESTPAVPAQIAAVKGGETELDGVFTAKLSWTNPSVDIAGNPLAEDKPLTITIKRGSEIVAELNTAEYALPGAECSWEEDIDEAGEYIYSVAASNSEGPAEDKAPTVELILGPTLALPYETSDFSEWLIDDSAYYCWDFDQESKLPSWSQTWAYSFNYSVFSPYVRLAEGSVYKLEATFSTTNESDDMGMCLVRSLKKNEDMATAHHNFAIAAGATDHTYSVLIEAVDPAAPALMSDEGEDPAEGEETDPDSELEKVKLPAGKQLLGFRPTMRGQVTLKNFVLTQKSELTGEITVIASKDGILYSAGTVSCPGAESIIIVDAAGRVLRVVKGSEASLDDLRGTGLVIVSANGHSLKIAL